MRAQTWKDIARIYGPKDQSYAATPGGSDTLAAMGSAYSQNFAQPWLDQLDQMYGVGKYAPKYTPDTGTHAAVAAYLGEQKAAAPDQAATYQAALDQSNMQ